MKTLYHVQEKDLIWDAINLAKEIMDAVLVQSLERAAKGKIELSKNKNPKSIFRVNFKGKTWNEDLVSHAKRILNLLNRFPKSQAVDEDSEITEIMDWFVNIAPSLLKIRKMPLGENICYSAAQVAEKGFRKELREMFNIGLIDGKVASGTMYEIIQAQTYQQSGGPGSITRANDYHVANDGSIVKYNKKTRNQGGKQLDLCIETNHIICYSTNKAQTSIKDGGGRTSEYEQDLGGTLAKRSSRFKDKGFEIKDNKLIIVVGMIDSRFFAHNPHAVKLIQSRIDEKSKDTFLTDSETLAKFIKAIDIPEVITNTKSVVDFAFNSLCRELE